MPWAFDDLWRTRSEQRIVDSRACYVFRNNTTGPNIDASSFDLFPSDSTVGTYLLFNLAKGHWGIRLSIDVPFDADSVEFVWEYASYRDKDNPRWKTLRVLNGDAFTKTGIQNIVWTPPGDWACVQDAGYWVRCRIASLSGFRNGGHANDYVRWNLRPLRFTGTSGGTLEDAYNADLSGTYLLYQGEPASNIVPIEMPVKVLRETARCKLVLSGCSYGAAPTVTLSGIDQTGEAISESIAVTGDGEYTSRIAFRDVTLVSVADITGGMLSLYQKRWGVIQDRCTPQWDWGYKEREFAFRTHWRIGDGATTTTFSLSFTNLFFWHGFYHYADKATVTFGGTTTGLGETFGDNGCFFTELSAYAISAGCRWERAINESSVTYNGCCFNLQLGALQFGVFLLADPSSTVVFRDCTFLSRRVGPMFASGAGVSLIRTRFLGGVFFQNATNLLPESKEIYSTGTCYIENASSLDLDFNKIFVPSLRLWIYRQYLNILDSTVLPPQISLGSGTTWEDAIRIKFSLGLTVFNESGDLVKGATVRIEDARGGVTELVTDENGRVSTQLLYATGTSDGSKFNWKYYNPYVATISAPGYQPSIIFLDMTKAREEVEVLMRPRMITQVRAAVSRSHVSASVSTRPQGRAEGR